MVEWANFDANRAAVVIVKIRKTLLVIDKSNLTALMPEGFSIDGFSRAFLDTQPTGGTIILDPGMFIHF